ncbi:MAG: metal-sulfur cluster assembly factor [candidate division WOR-3 bacterium]
MRSIFRLFITLLLVAVGVGIMLLPRWLPRRFLARTAKMVIPADTLPLDSVRLIRALETVVDPELGLNIVEVGLIDSLALDSLGNVFLVLGLTTPFCPFAQEIADAAHKALKRVPGVKVVTIDINPFLWWDPSQHSPIVRQRFYERFYKKPGTAPKESL